MSAPEPAEPPRPLYGEYATPEEQRARIRQPDATDALTAGHSLAAGPEGRSAAPPSPTTPAAGTAAVARPTGARLVDRVVAIGLLAYGLFVVVVSFATLADFPGFADTWMGMVGIDGAFTNVEQGRLWGTVAAVLFVLGWAVTALLTWRRLQRRRISFWLPLAGAALSYVVVTACLMVPLLGDPAIIGYLTDVGR